MNKNDKEKRSVAGYKAAMKMKKERAERVE